MFFGEPLQKNFPNVTPSQNPSEEVLFLPRTLQKIWQCYFSPSEKRFYRPLLKNCIQNQYTNDVTLPSAPRYFHPSEIDILDNNPFEKNFFPSIDSLRVSYETCWLLCGTSRLTNFREFVPFFQTSSNKVTHQM